MTLSIFYKQFSGNDSFETPEDRQSIYLDKLESEHPGIFCTMESAIFGSFNDEGFYATSVPQSHTGYVVTNKTSCGAIALFYSGAMERLAMVLGESYYVGCAGDDRAILIGESFMSLERFQNLCQRKYQGKGYFYNAETGIFSLAQGN